MQERIPRHHGAQESPLSRMFHQSHPTRIVR
jgi:hypothetical protein